MTIKGLKWGSYGWGCNPDELVTEVEAEENGERYFCVVSLVCDSEAVFVTHDSVIGYILDGDYRPGKDEFLFKNDCDSCWREQVEEMVKGDYEQLIRLGRLALRAYLDDGWETGEEAFIAEYIGKDVRKMDLPLVCLFDRWNEDEEDEEQEDSEK